MKLKTAKRIVYLPICLLLCALLSVTVLAGEAEWSLSYDEETLTFGTYTFDLYDPLFPVQLVGEKAYYYNYALEDYRAVETNAESNAVYASIIGTVYATEKGVEALDRLMDGEAASYMLASVHGACAPISNDLVTLLTEAPEDAEKRTFDVRDLENALYYSLLGVESYGFYGCAYGAVYAYEGEFYYIHYMDLGNQCFDADGNFSYRRGTVEGVKLEGDLVAELHTVGQDMNFYPLEYIDAGEEKNFDDTADYFDSARSAFVVGMVVFGFMIPTPLLIVGLVFPRSAKRGYPKYWYILAGVAALWMALSVLLMILVL